MGTQRPNNLEWTAVGEEPVRQGGGGGEGVPATDPLAPARPLEVAGTVHNHADVVAGPITR
jgi:hypothetical protein